MALKFLHVTAITLWVGSVGVLAILNLRLAGSTDRSPIPALVRQSDFIGSRIVGPSAGVALLAGVAAILVGHLGMPLWVIWGLSVFVLSMGFGATFLRRESAALGDAVTRQADDGTIAANQRRLGLLGLLNLLLLLSAVASMVLRPT